MILRLSHWLDQLSQRDIVVSAVGFSLLWSIAMYCIFPDVGMDGILYLRCAAAYDQSGLKAAMALYPWPFYSIVIAYIHHLGLSYINSGRLLDALLQAWMVYFFIRLVFHFNPTRRLGFWALLCILSYSTFNGQRSMLFRDFGYWAFYLTSIWLVLSFLKKEKQSYLWLFGLSTLLAALFRIEGVLIAAMTIVLFFFASIGSFTVRCRNSAILAWPFWGGVLLFLLLGRYHLHDGGRLQEIYNVFTHGPTLLMQSQKQAVSLMATALEPHYAFIPTEQMYFSMLIGFFFYKVAKTTQVVFLGLALYGWWHKSLIATLREKTILYGLILLQTCILFLFLMNQLFLTSRYVLALSLLILLWVPFGLETIYQKAMTLRERKWRFCIAALLASFFIYSILYSFVHIGPSKRYITDAADWLQQQVHTNDRILVNDASILYQVKGATATWDQELLTQKEKYDCQISSYRYVVLSLRHAIQPPQCANLQLERSFHNERGDVVNIYTAAH